MTEDKLNKDTFEVYRDYVDSKFHETTEHFDRLHECDQRIEQKVDNILSRIETQQATKSDRGFKVKLGIFTATLALVFGIIGAAITTFFKS